MTASPQTLYVANITSKDAADAFKFHEKVAAVPNSHLWARSETQIRALIEDGCLFGAWLGEDRQLVALCYSVLEEQDGTWEVGGLSVDDSFEGRGIGTILVRFAIAHTVVYEQPWTNGQEVIAHVHEANPEPRGILEKVGFKFSRTIEVPQSANPPDWMKRNAEGKIVGDEFHFPPNKVKELSAWFDHDLAKLTHLNIHFGLGPLSLEEFNNDLREIGQNFA